MAEDTHNLVVKQLKEEHYCNGSRDVSKGGCIGSFDRHACPAGNKVQTQQRKRNDKRNNGRENGVI
ncbi:hypothetical protein A3765_22160 [Oleiphilus sp. HI0130]|nr:hypothetical protein A3765_22160 [Oleiphilus sp. HI0130]